MKKILIMDLDDTVLSCDSFKFFLFFWFFKKKKIFLFNIVYLILNYILLKTRIINNKEIKQRFLKIAFFNSNKKEIIKFSKNFSQIMIKDFLKKNALKLIKKKYKKKILITASPNFYVQFIARSLKFDIFFSTKIDLDKNIGQIIGRNCYGNEKLKIIKKLKLNKNFLNFYTDSYSDLPLMKYCKFSYLVKKNDFNKRYLKN